MPRKIPRLFWLAAALAYFLFLYRLDATGLLGPDEPRYSSIARAMATSGDWVTPRLWGEPWFEKPALLYWMGAAGYRLGLGPELAPRLPVALAGLAFLVLFGWFASREFGRRAGWLAAIILGTSAMWIAFTHVAVTDVPLTASFASAMLLALPWVARRDSRLLPLAGALLGVAVLAKGLVPLFLAAPLAALIIWRRSGGAAVRLAVPLLIVALPWYFACYRANGWPFIDEFFLRHHFNRFTSGALLHKQPWWFYIPILIGSMLPWSAMLPLVFRRRMAQDPRRLFVAAWLAFGFITFSISVNKLPGYILPLLPAAALLTAIALDELKSAGAWLAACALLLAAYPVAAPVLGPALASGLSSAPRPALHWALMLPVAAAAVVWFLDRRKQRLAAALCVALGVALGIGHLRGAALPQVDRLASARTLWSQIAPKAGSVCLDNIHRSWRYGLNYYAITPLPECAVTPKPIRVLQRPDQPPALAAERVDPLTSTVVISTH